MNDTVSPAGAFEQALTLAFGPREEFSRVLAHALRRRCGGRVCLTLLPDESLALLGLDGGAPCPGTVLLDIPAPAAPCSEEALALRVSVIDWRPCAHRYSQLLAQAASPSALP